MMSSPPEYQPQSPPQSPLSPQEYETPTTFAQNQVQSIDSEESTSKEKKRTLPHVYHILEPPPPQSQPPVYVNESEIRSNQASRVYASLGSNTIAKTATAEPPQASPQDYRYNTKTRGDFSPAQESSIATKILKFLMVALVMMMLVVAMVISITALVIALREQTHESTEDIDSLLINQRSRINRLEDTVAQLQSLLTDSLERIEKVDEDSVITAEQLEFVSDTTGTLNSTLNQKIDNIASRLKSLSETVLDGVNVWNCTANIEESCRMEQSSRRAECTTSPVDYQTDQKVIDFSCIHLTEQEPSQITGTLNTTGTLNNNTLVCQCTIRGLDEQELVDSRCGTKVTRCTQISISLR